jgi:glycosyltransferase involved in cell wall biosynthesis
MIAQSYPGISVVVVTPDRYETIRETVKHLRNQTSSDRIELVIVAPSSAQLGFDESEGEGFWGVQVVEVGAIFSRSRARVVGIGKAKARVLAFIEDHAYPAEGWAEALLKAHEQPWAAVGPIMGNANPATAMSWANLFILYGPWVGLTKGGIFDDIPGENSSYKTHILRACGPDLQTLLNGAQDSLVHRSLRANGHQLYVDPKAKVYHYNFESPGPSVKEHFGCGRSFAGARARYWSALRRMLYAGGTPLIPLVRFMRIWKNIRQSDNKGDLLPGTIPALLLGLVSGALGELVGYTFGQGRAKLEM